MITPDEIKLRSQRYWSSQRALRAWLGRETLFPLAMPVGKPSARDMLDRFADVHAWIEQLKKRGKGETGYGYRIEFAESNHRQLGRQRLPQRVIFDEAIDFFRFIGRQRDFERFARLVEQIRGIYPELRPWIEQHPLKLLEYATAWPRLLAVLDYFRRNPMPGRYLRELDVPGVDTKFIHGHRAILAELLDCVLSDQDLHADVSGVAQHGFERRYGLEYEEPLIRFRLLDSVGGGLGGLTDITTPLSQFIELELSCTRVFVTENKINGLSFPPISKGMVIFGLGYGIGSLKAVSWLRDRDLYYWGDIDTHGFAILSQLRGYFPHVSSLLMDQDTLQRFKDLWVQEDALKRFTGELVHLTPGEREVFVVLRDDVLGERVRLEQERIGFSHVQQRLARIVS